MKLFLYLVLSACFLVVQPSVLRSQQVEIEVETGPEFHPFDEQTVLGCIQSRFQTRFPFDFYAAPSLGSLSCPSAEFFGEEWEACWLVDIWHSVEPGVVLAMLYFAILVL
ncbi:MULTISPECIES: hypothetical protein [unclassified Coleofasciculus]|uniref:hypothetical protein n=1 Tax=unclassified Coleofasciculus TaxID=2692782 RepID=UPI00187FE377|nr:MULTISPECIES: hypothetical protein [unclassified Coleofasciculus]MBE9124897.1 hypothetical protein [Coleofasciculus sp. LEGE 07081]MBE9147858.1 hypothetical protein [Coleofasciculus sp. LEGE 07092]